MFHTHMPNIGMGPGIQLHGVGAMLSSAGILGLVNNRRAMLRFRWVSRATSPLLTQANLFCAHRSEDQGTLSCRICQPRHFEPTL